MRISRQTDAGTVGTIELVGTKERDVNSRKGKNDAEAMESIGALGRYGAKGFTSLLVPSTSDGTTGAVFWTRAIVWQRVEPGDGMSRFKVWRSPFRATWACPLAVDGGGGGRWRKNGWLWLYLFGFGGNECDRQGRRL